MAAIRIIKIFFYVRVPGNNNLTGNVVYVSNILIMKKNKMNLRSLEVESFVTGLRTNIVRGGAPETWYCSGNTKCVPSVNIPCLSQGAAICSDDSC
jgi:hypothetical protein